MMLVAEGCAVPLKIHRRKGYRRERGGRREDNGKFNDQIVLHAKGAVPEEAPRNKKSRPVSCGPAFFVENDLCYGDVLGDIDVLDGV